MFSIAVIIILPLITDLVVAGVPGVPDLFSLAFFLHGSLHKWILIRNTTIISIKHFDAL